MNTSIEEISRFIPFIPLLPLLGAAINGLFGHRFPRSMVSLIGCGTVFISFLISCAAVWILHALPADERILSSTLYTWMASGSLSIDITFLIDSLSAVMILVITGVGFLIHVYSIGYMARDESLARYFSFLNLFTFAMLTLVLADSLPLMFLGWEGVGLCSYLLIGFWFSDIEKSKAGKKAFITNRIGDFGFLLAMMLLFRAVDTLNIVEIEQAVNKELIGVTLATAVCLMLFLGATGKSAQLPLYVWLPDAMAGPTPVSALIHAATMVTAGVYMIARMGFLFSLSPIAMLTVAGVGAATALFAATIGMAQNDIKKVLAYSTVSQLGFMFIAAGLGAYAIAIFHLATHAFFKACLFLGSGSVIHGMSGEQDIRQMGGLRKKLPITFLTFFAATLAIIGFPLTAGFMSKDAILWNAFMANHGTYAEKYPEFFTNAMLLIWVVGVIAACFTAFYMLRLLCLTFFSGALRARKEIADHVHESPFSMTMPIFILGLLSLGGGFLLGGQGGITKWLEPVVGASPLPEGHHFVTEAITIGITLFLSAVAAGIAIFLYGKRTHPFATTLATRQPWRWLYLRVLNKWHVDELYECTVLRPIHWFSRVVLYQGFDKRVIDGTLHLIGWLVRSIGYFGQLFQTGNLQRYLAIFVIGLALLMWGYFVPLQESSTPNTAEIEKKIPAIPSVPLREGGNR